MPLLPIAAAAAATFNLVCGGTISTTNINGDQNEPFSYTYRFDLDRKLMCDGDCKGTNPIERVEPGYLLLSSKNVDTVSERDRSEMTIDRETGDFKGYSSSENRRLGPASILLMKWVGKCERQPFTGFPQPVTKF